MATSGVTVFQLSRDSIIEAAMRKCGALAEGASANSAQLTIGQQALNGLVARFVTLGMPLWKRSQYSLTMTATGSYTMGSGQTVNIPFPLKIFSAVLRRTAGTAQDMQQISRDSFNLLNTASTGVPTQFTYQPYVNYGVLKIWPIPDSTTIAGATIELTYTSPIEGFSSSAETPDFPQEWQLALIYGLAVLLAPEYGVPLADRKELKSEARAYLDDALDYNYENASVFIQKEVY